MMMHGAGMIFGVLLSTVLLLGFAYIVWIMSNKESGNIKVIGQGIAIVLAVLALIMFLYGIYGGVMGRGKGGMCGMGGDWKMDGKMMDQNQRMMGK